MAIDQGLAIVIGGTGMLRPAVHRLLESGRSVAVVARHPESAAPAQGVSGEFIPVVGDWADATELGKALGAALNDRPVTHLVTWIHSPYRDSVMAELEKLLTPSTVVVRVWGSASKDPRSVIDADSNAISGEQIRDVVLGYQVEDGRSRWLTNDEISQAVLDAMQAPEGTYVAGRVEPWDQRP